MAVYVKRFKPIIGLQSTAFHFAMVFVQDFKGRSQRTCSLYFVWNYFWKFWSFGAFLYLQIVFLFYLLQNLFMVHWTGCNYFWNNSLHLLNALKLTILKKRQLTTFAFFNLFAIMIRFDLFIYTVRPKSNLENLNKGNHPFFISEPWILCGHCSSTIV